MASRTAILLALALVAVYAAPRSELFNSENDLVVPESTDRASEETPSLAQAEAEVGCDGQGKRCAAGSCCSGTEDELICTRKIGYAEPFCEPLTWCHENQGQNVGDCNHMGKGAHKASERWINNHEVLAHKTAEACDKDPKCRRAGMTCPKQCTGRADQHCGLPKCHKTSIIEDLVAGLTQYGWVEGLADGLVGVKNLPQIMPRQRCCIYSDANYHYQFGLVGGLFKSLSFAGGKAIAKGQIQKYVPADLDPLIKEMVGPGCDGAMFFTGLNLNGYDMCTPYLDQMCKLGTESRNGCENGQISSSFKAGAFEVAKAALKTVLKPILDMVWNSLDKKQKLAVKAGEKVLEKKRKHAEDDEDDDMHAEDDEDDDMHAEDDEDGDMHAEDDEDDDMRAKGDVKKTLGGRWIAEW